MFYSVMCFIACDDVRVMSARSVLVESLFHLTGLTMNSRHAFNAGSLHSSLQLVTEVLND